MACLILYVSTHWSVNPPAELMALWQLLVPSAHCWVTQIAAHWPPLRAPCTVCTTCTQFKTPLNVRNVPLSYLHFSRHVSTYCRCKALDYLWSCQQLWFLTLLEGAHRLGSQVNGHVGSTGSQVKSKEVTIQLQNLFIMLSCIWNRREQLINHSNTFKVLTVFLPLNILPL